MNEVWIDIEGFQGLYQISNLGRVKALERQTFSRGKPRHIKEHFMSTNKRKTYNSVRLMKDGVIYPRMVHRLVAQAFIPNPEGKPYVDHIDTDISNNRVDNLRWVTQKENCLNELTRQHNSDSKKGHKCYLTHHTEETKRKLSEMKIGVPLSEEHKRRLSESHKGIGKGKSNPFLKGKHWKVEEGKRVWY